jgi:alpha-L-rhamnosidase
MNKIINSSIFCMILFLSIGTIQAQIPDQLRNSFIWTTGTGKTAVFRKTFNVSSDTDSAQINIFADSYYALYINGKFARSGPSRFDPKWVEYDSFDITSFLTKGNNTVAVLVYSGISNGKRMNHAPGLTLSITGKDFSVVTDDTWKWNDNTRFKQPRVDWQGIYEIVNASTQTSDCLASDFDDSSWKTAKNIDGKLWGVFHERSIPLLSQKEIFCSPISLPATINQTLSVKFKRNYLLTAELEFDATDPCEVTIGGNKYIANKGTHRYRTIDPFGITDAALIISTTKPIALKNLHFFNSIYPFEIKGRFVSSDSILNRLWAMSVHTLQQVSEDGYQDCPWERAEWMGDAGIIEYPLTRVAMVGSDGVYSDPRLMRKMIRDIAQSADNKGRIKAHHPSDRFDIHAYIEDYSCIWMQSLREYYEYTNDSAFVREMWPVATNLMKWFLNQKAASGLINAREFVIFDNPLKYKTCEGATVNAFFYKALKDAEFLATATGDASNAALYSQSAESLRTAFNQTLWNNTSQLFNASSVDQPNFHSALLPLDRGIVDEDKVPLINSWLLKNYFAASNTFMTYTHFWFFKFLYAQDSEDWDKKAQDIMKLRYVNFYALSNVGYTVAEAFNGQRPFHNFGSSAAYFMSANILGVTVDLPLSKNLVLIKPQLGYLTKAEGSVVTEHGIIDVKWEKPTDSTHFKFALTIPEGKKAKVYLPIPVAEPQLSINGKQLKYKTEGRYAVIELEGGHYEGEMMPAFKLKSGIVPRNNAKIVVLTCESDVQHTSNLTGFSLKINNLPNAVIDSVGYSDFYQAIVLYLASQVTKNDALLLSYSNGNVLSAKQQELFKFNDFSIDNLLPGSVPKLSSAIIGKNGDEISLYFNQNMIADNFSTGSFKFTETTTNTQWTINSVSKVNGDSSIIILKPSEKLYFENNLVLSYGDSILISADGAKLAKIDNFVVKNNANGLPPQIVNDSIINIGYSFQLIFNKSLSSVSDQKTYFSVKINGNDATIKNVTNYTNTVTVTLSKPIAYQDEILVNFLGGKITATDGGVLNTLTNYNVKNSILEPRIVSQSTTAWGGDASRAVDGNTDGFYGNNSVTHTGKFFESMVDVAIKPNRFYFGNSYLEPHRLLWRKTFKFLCICFRNSIYK